MEVENVKLEDYLRKYIKKTCIGTLDRCGQILDNKDAVVAFGKIWQDNKDSLMMMMTAIEYEFISKENFTEGDLATIRHTIGNIALFFKGCSDEWEEDKASEKDK